MTSKTLNARTRIYGSVRAQLRWAVFTTAMLASTSAFADAADIPFLTALVGHAANQVVAAANTLSTIRQTYQETKRVASYASDAHDAFKDFQSWSAGRIGASVEKGIDNAFPDIAMLRNEASNTGEWAQGTGELQGLVTYCLGDQMRGGGCVELREAISMKQARAAISGAFGTSPTNDVTTRAADYEAAKALQAGAVQVNKNEAVTREQARALMRRCTDGTGSKESIAACQAAAHAATILQLEQSADMSNQLAEGNRLHAVQVAQTSEQRKREIAEAEQRQALLRQGAKHIVPEPVTVKTEGFQFFEGEVK